MAEWKKVTHRFSIFDGRMEESDPTDFRFSMAEWKKVTPPIDLGSVEYWTAGKILPQGDRVPIDPKI